VGAATGEEGVVDEAEVGGGDAGDRITTGLLLRTLSLVAQPAINVQHALNANQNVADRVERRIVKNLHCVGPV